MSQLGYRFHLLTKDHKQGSFNTRSSRKKILNLVADQLLEKGFKLKDPKSLKPKHINYLIERWKEEKLSASTIKNRMAVLRWTAKVIGKHNIILKTNDQYGIARRRHSPEGKAKQLDTTKLSNLPDKYLQFSVQLQEAFGLRREESIKFNVNYADKDDHIYLKNSWTKGGKARVIPITNQQQRDLLNNIRSFTKGGSLIPANKNYIQQLKNYETQTQRVGLNKNHGLRHFYARQRYLQLTGWVCPADGGAHRKELKGEKREKDIDARMQISKELGHGRFNVTYAYLGS